MGLICWQRRPRSTSTLFTLSVELLHSDCKPEPESVCPYRVCVGKLTIARAKAANARSRYASSCIAHATNKTYIPCPWLPWHSGAEANYEGSILKGYCSLCDHTITHTTSAKVKGPQGYS